MLNLNFITSNVYWIALLVIDAFLIYQFYKIFGKKSKNSQETKSPPSDSNPEEKENPLKRMARGFGVMYQKVADSDFVKNVQAEQESADPNEYLPTINSAAKEESKSKTKVQNTPDPFATDLSNLGDLGI